MLDGKYANEKIRSYYEELPRFPSIIHVALGVARSFKDLPYSSFGIDFPSVEKEYQKLKKE